MGHALSLLLAAAVLGSVVLLNLAPIADPDLWWHMAVGRRMFETRSLAGTDDFDHPHVGLPYENECWLFDLASYALWSLFHGGAAISVVQALVFLAVFSILLVTLRRDGVPWLAAAAALYVTLLLLPHRFHFRNYAVGYILFALHLRWLTSPRAASGDRRLLVPVSAVMVLWANLHAGCAMGVILAGLFLVAAGIDRVLGRPGRAPLGFAALLFLTVLAASGVSPYPFEWVRRMALNLFVYPGGSQAMEEIPPPAGEFPLFYACAAAGAIGLFLVRRRVGTFLILAFLFFAAIALRHMRFIGEFGLVFPLVAGALAIAFRDRAIAAWPGLFRPRAAAAATAVALALVAWETARLAEAHGVPGTGPRCEVLPCRAIEFIREADLSGNFYNNLGMGGFFVWNLYPARRAFWDGRFKAQIGLFEEFRNRPTAEVLERYGVRFALVPYPTLQKARADMGLISIERGFLDDPANWSLLHFDRVALVFAKNVPENAEAIALYGYRVLRPWRLDLSYLDLADPTVREALAGDLALARTRVPGEPIPVFLAAKFQEATGDHAGARRLLEDGVREFPEEPLFPSGLGALLAQEGELDQAAAWYRRAIEMDPDDARVHNNLGVVLWRLGEVQQAAWRFRHAVRLDPGLPEPYQNLASLYSATGRSKKAARYERLAAQAAGP